MFFFWMMGKAIGNSRGGYNKLLGNFELLSRGRAVVHIIDAVASCFNVGCEEMFFFFFRCSIRVCKAIIISVTDK